MADEHNSIVCVGDIHGHWPAVTGAFKYARANKCHVLFMGDFLDSYTASPEAQVRALKYVLDACDAGEATSLLGNHEASYLWPRTHKCSGFNDKTYRLLLPDGLTHRIAKTFRALATVTTKDGVTILITHAGVDALYWYDTPGKTFEEKVEVIEVEADNPSSRFYQVGRARGGWMHFGGPLWLDWNDEFTTVPGIIQVTGHNNTVGVPRNFKQEIVSGLRRSDNGDWNIDNVQRDLVGLRIDPDGAQTPVVLA